MASHLTHNALPAPDMRKDAPHVLIVLSPYYLQIAQMMRAGAEAVLREAGAKISVLEVPGALEIPPAIARAQRAERFDGYVALGCIIRGATTHYETVCEESARGITQLGLMGANIGNGILTVENEAQAIERADPAQMNKGAGAAIAALHLVKATRDFITSEHPIGF